MNKIFEKIENSIRTRVDYKEMKTGDLIEDVETKVRYRVLSEPFMTDRENWGIHAERVDD